MQFKQSLLAAVIFAVFAVGAPVADVLPTAAAAAAVGECSTGAITTVTVTVGGNAPSTPLPTWPVSASASANPGLPTAPAGVGLPDDPSVGGGGLPGLPIGGIPVIPIGGVGALPPLPIPVSGEPTDLPIDHDAPTSSGGRPGPTNVPTGPSATAGASATVGVPTSGVGAPTLPPLPVSTNLATSVSPPASAPHPTQSASHPGSPMGPQQPGGSDGNDGGDYGSGNGKCNTGPVQCCNSVQDSRSSAVQKIFGTLNMPTSGVTTMVGMDCSPINVLPVGGGSQCSAQTVCCEDNSHGSLISIGCVPVML